MKKGINLNCLQINNASKEDEIKNYQKKLKKAYKNYNSLVPLLNHIAYDERVKYPNIEELRHLSKISSKETKIAIYKDLLKHIKHSCKKDMNHSENNIQPIALKAQEIKVSEINVLNIKKYSSIVENNQDKVLTGIKITSNNPNFNNIINAIVQEQASHNYLKYFDMLILMNAIDWSTKKYSNNLVKENTSHRIIRNAFEDRIIDEFEEYGIDFYKNEDERLINNGTLLNLMRQEKENVLSIAKKYTKK